MGGSTHNPTYEDVKSGTTGHYETVKIEYDVALFSYNKLLEVFSRLSIPLMMVASFKIEVHNIEQLYSTRMRIKKDLLSNTFTNSSKQFIQKKQ